MLTYLARKAEDMPGLVVVLDEFPCLVEGDLTRMGDLLAERNPLYGRQTLRLEVKALPQRDAAGFFPDYPAEDRTLAYAIFGGVPFYLRLCDPGASLEENVTNLLLTDTGTLVDEPNVLLQSELRETQRYASILAAIADGWTKLGAWRGRSPLHPIYAHRIQGGRPRACRGRRTCRADDAQHNACPQK